jgi:preprotein translocase subunit SecG
MEISDLEAWLTFVFFFILIILSYLADRYKAAQDAKTAPEEKTAEVFIEFQAYEIMNELTAEKMGTASQDQEAVEKRKHMKKIMK